MKKALLLCAAALFSLMASAGDGLTPVGANVIIAPSSFYDGDMEWKAWTWVYNSGVRYNDNGQGNNTENINYNNVYGPPTADDEGREWFEPGFDMSPKMYGEEYLDFNPDTSEPIFWEEHTAPFSAAAEFKGRPSYQWTTGDVMADIYLRRTFTVDPSQRLTGPVFLACTHDDSPCEYYLNGELVYSTEDGWEDQGRFILLDEDQKALIKLDGEENLLAVHVHQNWGGALADCGLYTKIEGGLDMGYTTPWEGKVLFNSFGGYNWDGKEPSNNPHHPWSPLFEAQEGDVYTFTINDALTGSFEEEIWQQQLQFKTPIRIEEGHWYNFKVRVKTDKTFENFSIVLTDNDNTDNWLESSESIRIEAPLEGEEDYEGTLIEFDFEGLADVNNFMVAFDFGGGQDTTTVSLSDFSLMDVSPELDEEVELWVGTSYFNIFDFHKSIVRYVMYEEDENGELVEREATAEEIANGEADEIEDIAEVYAPEIEGRTETLSWTQADFDDSMWDDQMMPVGNDGFMPEVQSIWPGGDNTNYWIRRNFELESINPSVSYELNVCHDDVYETYVNGHLLQKNTHWTVGKNPVQVHIPAKYLNIGKNVIATYIQQNWGGKFYDCGINVTEVNYDDCLKQFNDALAYAKTDTLLTNKMWEAVDDIVAEAKQFYNENKNDAAELRNYAKELKDKIDAVFFYSIQVKALKDTYDICRKMEDKGYWGTTLTDAVAALDTCAVPSQWTDVLNNLRYARKATAMERHTENYVGCIPEAVSMDMLGDDMLYGDAPKYYIYNVGAKNFLGGGEAWGAHQALEYVSTPMMVIQAAEFITDDEGGIVFDTDSPVRDAYYIETYRPNGEYGAMDFLGWNGFVDVGIGNGTDNRWELIPVEGKTNVYHICQYGQTFPTDTTYNQTADGVEEIITGGGKKYLGLRGDNNFAPSYYLIDTDCKTPELETNQWMFITREEMLGFIKNASEDNPADLSFLINNPGYDQRWTIDDWMFSNGSVWGRGGDHPNFVLESYNTQEFSNRQEIWPNEGAEALPQGTYMLTVQGYYRDGIEDAHIRKVLAHQNIKERAYIFAGSSSEDFSDIQANCSMIPLMPIHIESGKYPGIGYYMGGMQMPGTYLNDQGFGVQPYSACSQAADDYFPVGLYLNKLAFHISDDDENNASDNRHLNIGVWKDYDENTSGGDWIVMDNWRLKYYGGAFLDPDGIGAVESDEIKNVPAVKKGIYNMLGQRLDKAQKGVNIIDGRKVIKK